MTIWIHLDRITFHGNRDHVSWFLYIYIYTYMMRLCLLVVAQLGTILHTCSTCTSSASSPLPLTSLCPWVLGLRTTPTRLYTSAF